MLIIMSNLSVSKVPFNFKAAKNQEFFVFKLKMSFEQEKFSVMNNIPKKRRRFSMINKVATTQYSFLRLQIKRDDIIDKCRECDKDRSAQFLGIFVT
jgi:hypothetical protein